MYVSNEGDMRDENISPGAWCIVKLEDPKE